MTVTDIEQRWKLIDQTGNDSYNSLRISSDCIPDLFIALDIKGLRFMMLKVPEGVNVQCRNVEMENLTLAWYNATRFILIGLLNDHYEDLFNDLLLSLYTRIKEMPDPVGYTEAFIGSFHRWAEFFDETASASLSEETVKGIFGELIVLKSYIDDADNARLNQVLNAWEGPYDRAHDFYFPGLNVEVKTKESDHVAVRITSEHQLQPEPGKQLQLAVVDIKRAVEGIDLNTLVTEIKTDLIKRGADVAVLLKALAKAGLRGNNALQYKHTWMPLLISVYDCNAEGFPKIITSALPGSISKVRYSLAVGLLQNFLIRQIKL